MALIKCPECGCDVSDKATSCPNCGYKINKSNGEQSPKSNKKWIVILICIIAILACGVGAWFMFGIPDKIADKSAETLSSVTSQPTELLHTPDLTFFEVSGNVKEIYDIENSLILYSEGKTIRFTKEGIWENYHDFEIECLPIISIKRDADGHIVLLKGKSEEFESSSEYEWNNGHPISEVFNGIEGGNATTLEYDGNKLSGITTTGNDFDDKYVITFRIKNVNTDNHGNWIERTWERILEYYTYNNATNGYSSKPDNTSSEEVVEKRKIIYWE